MSSAPLRVASFLYHDVTDQPSSSGLQRLTALRYKFPVSLFRAHLDQIALGGLEPKELVTSLSDTSIGSHLLLTFDDGGRSAVEAGDELLRRGWRGHFFVTTSRINTSTFVSSDHIVYLRSCGHLVGSHSHSHPDVFNALTMDQMLEEWRVSCTRISEILGEACVSASVPGGDISDMVLASADTAGIRYLFTSEPTVVPHTIGRCMILGRVCPRHTTPLKRVGDFARFEGWSREMRLRRLKVGIRTLAQPLYRYWASRLQRG